MTRDEALVKANAVRESRRAIREGLASGEIGLRHAMSHPYAAGMTLATLLTWQPWWGPVRARRAFRSLRGAGIMGQHTVGRLTGQQRLLVVLVCLSHQPPGQARRARALAT